MNNVKTIGALLNHQNFKLQTLNFKFALETILSIFWK